MEALEIAVEIEPHLNVIYVYKYLGTETNLCDHGRAGTLLQASMDDDRDCLIATELCGESDLDVSLGRVTCVVACISIRERKIGTFVQFVSVRIFLRFTFVVVYRYFSCPIAFSLKL